MRALNGVLFSNVSASQTFSLQENCGDYLVEVVATFGGGSVELQKLGPDASTYISLEAPFNNAGTEVDLVIGKFSANGAKVLRLPAGSYKFVVTTATAVYIRISRIPGE